MNTDAQYIVVPCESCIVSREGGVSAINIFTTINAKHVPVTYPFYVYGIGLGLYGNHEFTLHVRDPDGQEVDSWTSAINSDDPHTPVHMANRFECLFQRYGTYWLELSIAGELVARTQIQVRPR